MSATVASSIALASPAPAAAQIFGPMPVIDAGAIGKLVTQLGVARDQLTTLRRNMVKLGTYHVRDVRTTLAQVDLLVRRGEAISYSLANLDAELTATFPGSRVSPTMRADIRRQNERTLATIRGALAATQVSAREVALEAARIATVEGQLRSVQSAQQAMELEAVLGAHATEELTLLRQQLAASASAQAVVLANRINRDLQGAAAAEAFWRPGGSTPVRQKDMRVDAVGFVP